MCSSNHQFGGILRIKKGVCKYDRQRRTNMTQGIRRMKCTSGNRQQSKQREDWNQSITLPCQKATCVIPAETLNSQGFMCKPQGFVTKESIQNSSLMNELRLSSANLMDCMDRNILKDSRHSVPMALKHGLAHSHLGNLLKHIFPGEKLWEKSPGTSIFHR